MSAAITKYYNALSDLKALNAEIAKMEESKALKEELEFKAALEKLMDDYSKDAKEVAKIIGGFTGTSGRSKRLLALGKTRILVKQLLLPGATIRR